MISMSKKLLLLLRTYSSVADKGRSEHTEDEEGGNHFEDY